MTDAEMWMHRDKLRSTASQVTMWCGIIALHQEDGIGKDRLNKLRQCIARALQEEIVVVPDDYGELTFTLASEQQEAARQIKTQVFNEMARRNSKKQVCPLLSEKEMQRRCREVQKQIFGGMN